MTQDGQCAGDDVIIFDKLLCPTLRSGAGLGFATKDQIPAEAVYAYIECKHSIENSSVLDRAATQVRRVKSLLLQREPHPNPEFESDGPVYLGTVHDWPRTWPRLKNQPFGMVFARHADPNLSLETVRDESTPDMIILGENSLMTQSVNLGPDGIKAALFYDSKHFAPLRTEAVKGMAFGIGIITLMQALAWIELKPVPWTAVLNRTYWNLLESTTNTAQRCEDGPGEVADGST